MRRTAIRCTSATCSTATGCARGSANPGGCATARPRSRRSTCSRPPSLTLPRKRGREREGAPVNVFIHGGAWRQRSARDYAFLAEMFVRAGAHFVALDFVGVEATKGDLLPMADQVRRGVAWVYRNAKSFGGDPNRLYVSGQSSGAHLAGCVVTTDWKDYGVPHDVVKGALLCSGMYDLKPVRLSKRSEYVAFTDEIEDKLSSQRHLDKLNCPVIVSYGTYETPEFQRQNRDFAAAVKAKGLPVTLLVGEGYNHFEMAELIGNPLSLLGSAVLEQMGIA
ncbi:MAG: alpha/beta hydrolase [Xanthobacteraceae bacterium]